MVYISSWHDYQEAAEALYAKSPNDVRELHYLCGIMDILISSNLIRPVTVWNGIHRKENLSWRSQITLQYAILPLFFKIQDLILYSASNSKHTHPFSWIGLRLSIYRYCKRCRIRDHHNHNHRCLKRAPLHYLYPTMERLLLPVPSPLCKARSVEVPQKRNRRRKRNSQRELRWWYDGRGEGRRIDRLGRWPLELLKSENSGISESR